jgi:hypothetical protein
VDDEGFPTDGALTLHPCPSPSTLMQFETLFKFTIMSGQPHESRYKLLHYSQSPYHPVVYDYATQSVNTSTFVAGKNDYIFHTQKMTSQC